MSLFTPDTSMINNFYHKEKFLMAWRISLFFIVVFAALAIIFGPTNPDVLIAFLSTFLAGIFCSVYLYKTKKYKPVYWGYAIVGSLISNIAMNLILDVSHFVDFIWIIACILIAFIGLGKKEGLFFLILNLIGISYFVFFSYNNHISILKHQTTAELSGILLEIIFSLSVLAYLLHQYILFQNYSYEQLEVAHNKLEEQNQLIKTRDEEKTTLVKEIHHRVKNNLQIIISLLRLQKGELKSDEAKRHFSEAINRIMVMSLIHKKLYQQEELSKINIESYLKDLSADITSIADLGFPIEVKINSNIKNIGLKTIVPLGLLINELMTNSIKHAFFKKENGIININISEVDENFLELTYTDNGKWKESKNLNPSFGLELIEILTSQLEGDCKRTSDDNGTTYQFYLKNIDINK